MKVKITLGEQYNNSCEMEVPMQVEWKQLEPNRHKVTIYLAEEARRIERDLLDLIKPD